MNYGYITLLEKSIRIDLLILNNLVLRGSITPAGQVCVSHRNEKQHVFDHVVDT